MPVPTVAIEIAPPTAAKEAVTVLTEACSTAVRLGRCTLAASTPEEAPVAIAIVSWLGSAHRHARVQVGVRREERGTWATREVYFEPQDPEDERWRSIGLTIAILIGELPETRALVAPAGAGGPDVGPGSESGSEPKGAASPPAPSPPTPKPSSQPVEPAQDSPSRRDDRARRVPPRAVAASPTTPSRPTGFVTALVVAGSGLEHGPVARGAEASAARSLAPVPLWVPVRIAYTWRPRSASLKVDFLTLSAGIAHLWFPHPRFALKTEAFATLELLSATATASRTGRQDSAQRWAPLFGAGVAPMLALAPDLWVVVGGRLSKSSRTFTFHDEGTLVARSASWPWGIEVGPVLTFH